MKKSNLFRRCPGCVRGRSRRGAALYVTVLGTSLLVTVIALSSIEIARARLRSADLAGDAGQARLIALSSIEVALTYCNSTPGWRTTLAGGSTKLMPFGDSKVQFQALDDADGDLLNDERQLVRLIGTGVYGSGRYRASVLARPLPLSCLSSAVHAGANVDVQGTIIASNVLSANGSVTNSGLIDANVESVGSVVNNGTITGSITEGITPKGMPTAAVFDYYTDPANGTPIDIALLPTCASGEPCLEEVLLSPASNPYGVGNPQGIYVIDCRGQDLTIQTCRIVGTLVLLNTGANVKTGNSLNWEPAVAGFPALLVSGTMSFQHTRSAPLDESLVGAGGTNFNPQGTPYAGIWDDLIDDVYPTVIKGLVYVSGNAQCTLDEAFDGVVVVGGTLGLLGNMSVTYKATYLNNPPPGFLSTKVKAVPGSWRQEPEP